MQSTELMAWLLPAGLAVVMAGLAGEYARRSISNSRQRVLLGAYTATVLAAGLILLTQVTGWPIGIAVWLGLVGMAGFAVTFTASVVQDGWPQSGDGVTRTQQANRNTTLNLTKSLVSIANAALCALLIMLALTLLLPLAPTDRALTSVVIWPLLWAGLSIYLLTARQYHRAQVIVAMVTVLLAVGAAVRWNF